jgi:hypothetical protein
MLPDEEVGRKLLRIARAHLLRHYGLESGSDAAEVVERFGPCGGVFATLELERELRGCVGYVLRSDDLGSLLKRAVVAAATDDPRFPRVEREDVARLSIAVTVLAAPVPLQDPAQIAVGRDGLIVERGAARGLLLPQVAERRGWSATRFLAETCRKAGLSESSWREPGTTVQRFEAVHFEESSGSCSASR